MARRSDLQVGARVIFRGRPHMEGRRGVIVGFDRRGAVVVLDASPATPGEHTVCVSACAWMDEDFEAFNEDLAFRPLSKTALGVGQHD